MKIKETELDGVFILTPEIFEDKRGYFYESFNYYELDKHVGKFNVVQVNVSKSKQNVLRGLHFQKPPISQAKIVEVISGVVLDVVVDIRKDSKTFGQHQSFVLDGGHNEQIFIPRGFAHGFVVLSNQAKFQYKVDNHYSPTHETGIRFDDPTLGIDWEIQKPVVNEKDMELKSFKDIKFYDKDEYF